MAGTEIASGAGLKHVRVFTLDTEGYPDGDQSGADGYDGTRIEGAKSFTSTVPDAQVVNHRGDDTLFAADVLPPTELETAVLTTGKTNLTVDALLTGTKVADLGGGAVMGGLGTDKQGAEVSVALMGWRQALDTEKGSPTFGTRRYIVRIYPSARVIPKPGSMDEGADDVNTYNVVPTKVTKAPWGELFSEAVNGFTEGQSLRIITEFPPMLERFDGNGTIDEFNLKHTPISVAKTRAWVNGTPATVDSVDLVGKTFTLHSAPAFGSKGVVFYETSESLS